MASRKRYRGRRIPEYDHIWLNYDYLTEQLRVDIDMVIRSLCSKGVLDDNDKSILQHKGRDGDKRGQTKAFLEKLMYCGEGAYDAFIETLREESFVQVVEKLEQDDPKQPKTNSSRHQSTYFPHRDHQIPSMSDMGSGLEKIHDILDLMRPEYFKDRPSESSTFKRIKDRTVITLKDCYKNNYVKTRAFHEGLKRLTEQSIIGIIGAAGDGKSILCKIIAHQFIEEHTEYVPVLINDPCEFNEIQFFEGCKFLIILDDMFGKSGIKKNKLYKYDEILEQIRIRIGLGHLAVIYSMREYVFKTCQYKINQYDILYSDNNYIRLHSEFALDMEEKRQLLYHYNCSEKEVSRMITMSENCFGFPAIASFSSKCNRSDRQGIYNSVTEFLLSEIIKFWHETKDIYTALLLIFCLQPVSYKELKSESLKVDIINLKPKIKELYKDFEMTIAIEKCSDLSQTFIQFVEKNQNKIYSLQEYVSEAFLKHLSETEMDIVLEYCPMQLLLSMTVIKNSDDARQVVIKPDYYQHLSQRFLREIQTGNNDIFDHPAFLNSQFLKTLLEQDSAGLLRTFDNINLGKIRYSEDRGNILHYITVYGDVKCLRQLALNDMLTSYIRSKTSSGNNCHGLSVISTIEPLKKLQLLQEYDAPMPVDLPHMAVQSNDIEIIRYVAQKINIETLLDSNTILHSVCDSEYDVIEIVEFIFQNSQIDINAQNKEGFTALHLAARHGKLKTINYLLSREASVDVQDNQGRLPLHLSVSTFTGRRDIDTAEIVSVLLNSGSDLYLKDNNGHTAFDEAIYNFFLSAIKLMIYSISFVEANVLNLAASHLNPKFFEDILRQYMKDHSTVEPITLFNCCWSDRDTVDKLKLLKSHGVNMNMTDDDLSNILHICCLHSSISVVKYVVEELNIDIHAKDKTGATPLTVSTMTTIQPIEKLTYLINRGASKHDKNDNGHSLLHYSCQHGQLEVMKYVIDELGLDWKDTDSLCGPCLFYCAASTIHPVDKIELLLEKGASKYDEDDNGLSFLPYSCTYGQLEVVKYIIDELGLDWKDTDSLGGPCLFYCAGSKIHPIEKMKLLLEKGASKYYKDDGRSLLYFICKHGQLEVVKYIIDELGLDWKDTDSLCGPCLFYCAGSKIHPIDKIKLLLEKGASKYEKDDNGCNVLHYGCKHGQLEVVKYIIDEIGLDWKDTDSLCSPFLFYCVGSEIHPIDKMKLLLKKGASKYDKNDNGVSLLYYSCTHGQLEVVKYIIDELGLNWKDTDSFCGPCLFYCAGSKIHPIYKMKLLLKKGASKYDKDDKGHTLLHYSCQYGQLEVVKYVIDELGLDWKDTNSLCGPCLFYCAGSKIHPIDKIKLLLKKGASKYDKDDKGQSLLHYSCGVGQLEMVKYIIGEIGLDWKDTDSLGRNCLFYCAESTIHPIDKIKLFLEKGASKYDKDDKGLSLLHYSFQHGQLEVVKYVIYELGLDWKDIDSLGVPCLLNCARSTIHPIEKMKLLLEKGASKYDKDDNGWSLLHYSCQHGQLEVVNYVIEDLNLNVNDKNKPGLTALVDAAISTIQPVEKLRLLSEKGAFKMSDSRNVNLALFLSCQRGSLAAVKYLVDVEGLAVNCRDFDETPLLAACQSNIDRLEKIGFLISKGGQIIICRPYKDYFSDQ